MTQACVTTTTTTTTTPHAASCTTAARPQVRGLQAELGGIAPEVRESRTAVSEAQAAILVCASVCACVCVFVAGMEGWMGVGMYMCAGTGVSSPAPPPAPMAGEGAAGVHPHLPRVWVRGVSQAPVWPCVPV